MKQKKSNSKIKVLWFVFKILFMQDSLELVLPRFFVFYKRKNQIEIAHSETTTAKHLSLLSNEHEAKNFADNLSMKEGKRFDVGLAYVFLMKGSINVRGSTKNEQKTKQKNN